MFSIRPGSADDLLALEAIDATFTTDRVWQVECRTEAEELAVRLRPVRLPRPISALARGPSSSDWLQADIFLVAADATSGRRLGLLIANRDSRRSVACLELVVVAAEHRRQGVGRALLVAAKRWAKERGLAAMVAEVPTRNYPATRFLERCDFVICGYNDRVFPGRDIALLMCADLGGGSPL